MGNLTGALRRAMQDYAMVDRGDKIAVGVSGGKDSAALLFALNDLRSYYPVPFTVIAVWVDPGNGADISPLRLQAEQEGIVWHTEPTQISRIVFDLREEQNPCSLCANLRRGALNNAAAALGCNKVALGHHRDDVLETFCLNLIYGGRLGCFQPVTKLDRTGLTVIRPMIYVSECDTVAFCRQRGLSIAQNPCPMDRQTHREEMKALIREMERRYPGLKKRIFGALQRSGLDEW